MGGTLAERLIFGNQLLCEIGAVGGAAVNGIVAVFRDGSSLFVCFFGMRGAAKVRVFQLF
jgi:hypothetical protein